MLRFFQDILIKDYNTGVEKFNFPNVVEVEIVSSKLEYTDTATVSFMEQVSKQYKSISEEVTRGDKIEIWLGYFDSNAEKRGLIKEFDGYITEIIPGTPTTVKCEDAMYLLKQETIEPKVFKNTNLKEILSYYYKDQYITTNADIGTWQINKNVTLVEFFEELNTKFGILTYFQDGILYCNAELERSPEKTVILDVRGNVVLGSDELQAETPENYKLVVHGISPQKNGQKIERWAAFKDITRTDIEFSSDEIKGVQNEVNVPDRTESQLDKLLEIRLKRLYEASTRGAIGTLGYPSIKHGDFIEIINSSEISKNGLYESVGVVKNVSVSGGYKQTVNIGLKIA